MLKELRAYKLTCDRCKIEKIHVKEYTWQPNYPEGWIVGRVYRGPFFQTQYKHYCSADCYARRSLDVEIVP
jgi:hypothetical protein